MGSYDLLVLSCMKSRQFSADGAMAGFACRIVRGGAAFLIGATCVLDAAFVCDNAGDVRRGFTQFAATA